jgi:hypothetical protein
MSCFFREDTLSDLVGFTYATWHGDDAAANLVQRAHPARALLRRRSGKHAVLIALDGENAWEYYPFNGYYFLRALYAQLAHHPQSGADHAVGLPGARHPAGSARAGVCRQLGARDACDLDGGCGEEPRLGSAV